MSDIKLNLPDSNNWEPIYTGSQVAVHNPNIPNHVHTPIPELSIPVLVDKFVLAVLITSNGANPKWRFAGFLSQRVNTGLTVGNNYDADATIARKVYLDKIQLVVFPEVSTNYALAFKCPYWIPDFTINIWEYQGETKSTLEQKIDILLSKHT